MSDTHTRHVFLIGNTTGITAALSRGLKPGLIEEGIKLAFLVWLGLPRVRPGRPYDALVYAVAIGTAFGVLEAADYAFVAFRDGASLTTVLEPRIKAIVLHASFGAIMGYCASRALTAAPSTRRVWLGAAYIVPAFLHTMSNTLVALERERIDSISDAQALETALHAWWLFGIVVAGILVLRAAARDRARVARSLKNPAWPEDTTPLLLDSSPRAMGGVAVATIGLRFCLGCAEVTRHTSLRCCNCDLPWSPGPVT